ncbi:hypothetical protein BFR78_008290 [Acinetobacter pittii]|nr:hypothetical protein [Acinetobacter pittii]MCK0877357.1 hypothetical protein [Acinetobacter pittii]
MNVDVADNITVTVLIPCLRRPDRCDQIPEDLNGHLECRRAGNRTLMPPHQMQRWYSEINGTNYTVMQKRLGHRAYPDDHPCRTVDAQGKNDVADAPDVTVTVDTTGADLIGAITIPEDLNGDPVS